MSAWKYFPLLSQQGKCDDKGNCPLASKSGMQKEEVGTMALGRGHPVALWALHPVGAGLLMVDM